MSEPSPVVYTPQLRESVLSQARDALGGKARAAWTADWAHEWAIVLLELDERLEECQRMDAG